MGWDNVTALLDASQGIIKLDGVEYVAKEHCVGEEHAAVGSAQFYFYLIASGFCILFAGLMSGLTVRSYAKTTDELPYLTSQSDPTSGWRCRWA